MGWLVLSRNVGQMIQVGPKIIIRVDQVRSTGKVRLAFNAPKGVNIVRSELLTDGQLQQLRTPDTPQQDVEISG